jgi:hypothetical protein
MSEDELERTPRVEIGVEQQHRDAGPGSLLDVLKGYAGGQSDGVDLE